MVWLLALLFAGSGVAMHLCAAAHHASAPAAQAVDQAHHAHAAIDDEQASQAHDATPHEHAADDGARADAACDKCCGTCTLAAAVMPALVDEASFVVSPAVFAGTADRCSGSMIRVDPGIPKRIV
jgi:hypothetical protein